MIFLKYFKESVKDIVGSVRPRRDKKAVQYTLSHTHTGETA
jgi:hypothetical protein